MEKLNRKWAEGLSKEIESNRGPRLTATKDIVDGLKALRGKPEQVWEITFSEIMLKQLQPPAPITKFPTFRKAYYYVVSRWGSEVIESGSVPRLGLTIKRKGD
jgi:hypothetical protein